MKTQYICEKCGAHFDTWQEANACEENHVSAFEVSPEWNPDLTWNENNAFPDEVIVRSREWNWRTGKYEHKYFKYKAAGSPTKKRVAELESERERREAEAEAAYQKRVAELKADQEAKAEHEAACKADHEVGAEPEQEAVG